jgi:hypothetical protein
MRLVQLLMVVVVLPGCAHQIPNDAKANCHVESGWLDSTSGCSARAGYPDCYRVCPDGSRVRVQNEGDADAPPKAPPPQ